MRWSSLVVVGVAVAALAGAYWYLAQYRPLAIGSMVTGDERYDEAGTFFYGFTLRNDGRLPVSITEVNLESDRMPLFVRREARIGFVSAGDRRGAQPFAGFTLGPGDDESITVLGHFDNCERYPPGTGTRRTVQLVRYRVLWIVPAEQEVELGSPIEIRSPPDARCPGRE